MDSQEVTQTTRSGRQVRKPVRYEPKEIPLDDFKDEDYDSDDPNGLESSDEGAGSWDSEEEEEEEEGSESDDSFIDDED